MALEKATTVAHGVCSAIASAATPAAATPAIAAAAASKPSWSQVLLGTELVPGAATDPDFKSAMVDVMGKAKDQLKGGMACNTCNATCTTTCNRRGIG